MKLPERHLATLKSELSHLYMRIDFRDEKYKEQCDCWQQSEIGVVYLEKTVKIQILALDLKAKIKLIESTLINKN